jgi:hypothetical protein
MSPKRGSLGHEESNRSRLAPALPAPQNCGRRGHRSRVPSGSPRSTWTGPGRAAGKHPRISGKGRLWSGGTAAVTLVRRHGRSHTKDLYRVWSLWRNYCQPVMRLESKTRTGSKVHRRYDVPATPCQRLLASGQLSMMARQSLE